MSPGTFGGSTSSVLAVAVVVRAPARTTAPTSMGRIFTNGEVADLLTQRK
jgi:hypothetical protein